MLQSGCTVLDRIEEGRAAVPFFSFSYGHSGSFCRRKGDNFCLTENRRGLEENDGRMPGIFP